MGTNGGEAPDERGPGAIPFREIVEASVSPYVVVDEAGYVLWAGPGVELLLGRTGESYVGQHFLDVIHPSSHEAAIAAFTDFVRPERAAEGWFGPPMLLELVGVDGPVTCEVSASAGVRAGLPGGALLQVRRWRGTVLLYQAVDALVGGDALPGVLTRLVELAEHDQPRTSFAVAYGWDGERFTEVVAVDPVAADLVAAVAAGAPTPWHEALEADEVVGAADLGGLDALAAASAAEAGFAACWAYPVRVRPDPTPTAALVAWRRIEGPPLAHLTTTSDRVARLVALALEFERTRLGWERAARTDDLTGLSNRIDLGVQLHDVAAADPDRPVAALFCDLDDFKPVNDGFGHDVGDHVLAAVAERIRRAVRPSDLVARWGGDEFVVLCTGPTTAGDAVAMADRLIGEVNRPIAVGGSEVELGVSIGVSTALAGRSTDLVRRADTVLRLAKSEGKNRWRLAPPDA